MTSKIEQLAPLFQEILTAQGIETGQATQLAQRLQEAAANHLAVGTAKQRALPEKAPALWAVDKQPGETPPAFIQRHYEPWLGQGLSRANIYHLDRPLYTALAKWLMKEGNELPEGFLPTRKERADQWVTEVTANQRVDPKNLNRLAAAIKRRDEGFGR